jgi:cobalt-zinc-cadmium resistance protein CzcA
VLKIYGEDLNLLASYADQVGKIARKVEGANDVYVEPIGGLPQFMVTFDRNKLAQFGLSIEEVNRVLRTGFAGETAGVVYENEKRFDLVVRLQAQDRIGIESIKNLYVTTAEGKQIPLEQLARIELKEGANQIQRDDAKRRIAVGFNIRGRDVESIVREMKEKISREVKFEPGYFVSFGGSFKNLEEAKQRLLVAVPVALLLILGLLYFTFHSLKQGLMIFTAIPLSAIGGIVALWIRGMPFSISAGVGFIALFGVAVLNGIVLIGEFNRLKKLGELSIHQIVMKGTEVRLRPVMMTSLVASLGFLPMALSHGSGAEVQRPLATVVIGGLITATLLTLIVLPILYTYFEKDESKITSTT